MWDDIINANTKANTKVRKGKIRIEAIYHNKNMSEFLKGIFHKLDMNFLGSSRPDGESFIEYVGTSPYFDEIERDEGVPLYGITAWETPLGVVEVRVERYKNE